MENPTQPTSEGTKPTHNNKPKGDAPNLAAVPVDDLIAEIYRRQRFGECVALVITPSDLSEYWDCDDSGATNPASRIPEAGEMHAIGKAFERWQDCGGMADVMDVCRDAWQAVQAEQLDQEGGAK
jgi:hypothetical protein